MRPRSRFQALTLLVLLAAAPALAATDVSVIRVFTGWRDAASFKRISEYFTGRENTGGQLVLRTQPAQRAGYYFLVRLATGADVEVQLRLEVLRPQSRESTVHSFSARLPSGESVLNLGLTGTDWPSAESDPVAWKLDVLTTDGSRVLASTKSFLWDKPPGN